MDQQHTDISRPSPGNDIDKAVAAAEKALPGWARLPARKRAAIIRKFAALMDENKHKVSEVCGNSPSQVIDRLLTFSPEAYDITNYFAGLVEIADGETSLNSPDSLNISMRQPFGVVASITPWNFPTMIWCHHVVPASGAGNAVILKTSEKAPLSEVLLAQLAYQAGFPPGIINVVSGPGQTGALLSAHMRRAIMQAAAKSNLKTVSLELGRKSPVLAFDDANLEATAAASVKPITFNSGQVCTASSRLYLVSQLMLNLRLRDARASSTHMGPQADSKQAAAVARYLEAGLQDGQALSELNMEEVFGPVLVLHEFETEEEAVRRAYDTEYGVYASVFTKDVSRALRVVRALEAGRNCTSPDGTYELPFGGWKASGIRSQKGSSDIFEFTQGKSVYINHSI
ncbi:Aldehyde/histidinol dehydrogenase [Aspergillus pseudonomiae]|uniref:aldehyde dehydrogenase (NAD(+)) n=1 Tax=Aspergillus pseudonomiae TaxID=1506151 RepID=A0A5N7D633_9EURO|nr:Aldehyde/histidinol dehydrogenase [Aspergillus pseudonomiae]KAE8401870.1 Aldehyde/histidinol dehydrogenase [Aspergillus pseudonomiae]